MTTSRARWKMVLESSSPRAWLSCRTTRAKCVTCTALSMPTARPTMAVTASICFALMPSRISGFGIPDSGFDEPWPSRYDFFFLLLTGHAAAQAIQLVVQRLQADAENLGGARLVVAR